MKSRANNRMGQNQTRAGQPDLQGEVEQPLRWLIGSAPRAQWAAPVSPSAFRHENALIRDWTGLKPQRARDSARIDAGGGPPRDLVATAMHFAVMAAA
jgi:hypothetical protein